ncbi:hypothetical protein [Brytella acorum]|uniref:Uncharacterized protein n=1 Tax=Brytella acorum TaxID=2959299 RepID=A0AA35UU77_9PROT|nr:hypothetical protein [Brytella acorum]CAI9119530.1 hypothetical protein LMG32879_000347 [Brytella acorum]
MKKILLPIAFLASISIARADTTPPLIKGFVPGGNKVIDVTAMTPAGRPIFDFLGRLTGDMSPSALYSSTVSSASVANQGAYAPSDLPLTLGAAGNSLGQTAQIVPTAYTATLATVAAAGNNCPASSVFTLAGTGSTIIVSDGNGLAGAQITVSVGGNAQASAIPANPVTLTSSTSGCTPPTFNLAWGLAGVSVQIPGWGYTSAPTVTAPLSTFPGGVAASVLAQVQMNAVNLASQPVTADIANAPYSNAWRLRNLAATRLHLGEQGVLMNGSSSDEAIVTGIASANAAGREIVVPFGTWPDVHYQIPDVTHGNAYLYADPGVTSWPYFVFNPRGEGIRIPFYGNGITSETHSSWNSSGLVLSRVDTGTLSANAYKPVVQHNMVADTPNEAGTAYNSGARNVDDNLIVTLNYSGFANNHSEFTYDQCAQGYGCQTVAHFNKMFTSGTASWDWNEINEMNDNSSINFGSSDYLQTGVRSSARYNVEYDMAGVGPEYAASAYDPSKHVRIMGWYGLNTNQSGDPWAANTAYGMHHIVTVKDSGGNRWMYDAGTNGGTSGAAAPAWPYDSTTTVTDGTVTWTPLGQYHFDVGAILGVGGYAQDRIGTLMFEKGAVIYNSIFDMSEASFLTGITKTFGRLQPDMYLDMSANGTAAGQNQRLFGYSSGGSLVYYIPDGSGGHVQALAITDAGVTKPKALAFTDQTTSINSLRDVVQSNGTNNISLTWDSYNSRYKITVDGSSAASLVPTPSAEPTVGSSCAAPNFYDTSAYHYGCGMNDGKWHRVAWSN